MSELDVVQFIRGRLSSVFPIERLILFGSRARGMETSSSDYDVIVVAQSDIPFIERQGKAILALKGRSFPVDLIVYTPEELLAAGKVPGTAAYWALLEGRSYA